VNTKNSVFSYLDFLTTYKDLYVKNNDLYNLNHYFVFNQYNEIKSLNQFLIKNNNLSYFTDYDTVDSFFSIFNIFFVNFIS
jgi:hypothetical protein